MGSTQVLQCISHTFIHNPFFISSWLNRAYSLLETFALGVPACFIITTT
jgi:hypothetical protein